MWPSGNKIGCQVDPAPTLARLSPWSSYFTLWSLTKMRLILREDEPVSQISVCCLIGGQSLLLYHFPSLPSGKELGQDECELNQGLSWQ